MADTMYHVVINAPAKKVYALIAGKQGIQQWGRTENRWRIQGEKSIRSGAFTLVGLNKQNSSGNATRPGEIM